MPEFKICWSCATSGCYLFFDESFFVLASPCLFILLFWFRLHVYVLSVLSVAHVAHNQIETTGIGGVRQRFESLEHSSALKYSMIVWLGLHTLSISQAALYIQYRTSFKIINSTQVYTFYYFTKLMLTVYYQSSRAVAASSDIYEPNDWWNRQRQRLMKQTVCTVC